MVVNDSIAGSETIDRGVDISRKNFSRFTQRRPQQVLGQRVTPNETIDAYARVVGMKLNDPVESTGAQLVLQDFDFCLGGCAPEFPVQVPATARLAGVVFETSRIADGINLEMKVLSDGRFSGQLEQKTGGGKRAGRFVSMNGGKDSDTDGIAAVGATEGKSRQRIFLFTNFERPDEICLHSGQVK